MRRALSRAAPESGAPTAKPLWNDWKLPRLDAFTDTIVSMARCDAVDGAIAPRGFGGRRSSFESDMKMKKTKRKIWIGIGAFVVAGAGAASAAGPPAAQAGPALSAPPGLPTDTAIPLSSFGRVTVAQHGGHAQGAGEAGEGEEREAKPAVSPV